MTNAYDRYKVLLEQVAAYNESFKAAEVRYNSGVGTSIDYLTAKDRLDRANINLIIAKYDFVLRKKVLDYYSNPSTLRQ
jgi:outer membrane protein